MPRDKMDSRYAELFESSVGNDGIGFRTLLGAQLIKQEYGLQVLDLVDAKG